MSHQRLDRKQRNIIERIIIKGDLILDTPTGLGTGDKDGATDLMLQRDSITNCALLTGASIAGALRNYLHEYERGYEKEELKENLSTLLFGAIRKDKENDGDQSPLIVYDSISKIKPEIDGKTEPDIEIRDGVRINSKTGTAEDEGKYDLELLTAGTIFSLYFELLIEKDDKKSENEQKQFKDNLIKALIIALQGLEKSEINIGMKKRRGFGKCHVENWEVWQFDLNQKSDLIAWLTFERDWKQPYSNQKDKNENFLKTDFTQEDARNYLMIKATFSLASPLLIRSGQNSIALAPDVVHLKSKRNGKDEPVISGTSLAGVLRHRSDRIINTLNLNSTIIDNLFGFVEGKQAKSSRLVIEESVIQETHDLVQNRIAIDRFTGGVYQGALFNEQPVFPKESTRVVLNIKLRNPEDYEIGLLLLLLKDLWTSDLPIGGTSSIGRGRLKGSDVTMTQYNKGQSEQIGSIKQKGKKLEISDAEKLQECVDCLIKEKAV